MEQEGPKTPLSSKTFHFNWWTGLSVTVFVHAIWPFIPESFRAKPYAVSAVSAWLIIGNLFCRAFTTEALVWSKRFTGGNDVPPKAKDP